MCSAPVRSGLLDVLAACGGRFWSDIWAGLVIVVFQEAMPFCRCVCTVCRVDILAGHVLVISGRLPLFTMRKYKMGAL